MSLPAVTIPRIEEMLTSMELKYVTENGAIKVAFDNCLVSIFLYSEPDLMEISTMWRAEISKEHHEAVARLCAEINAEMFFPKMGYHVDDEDDMTVIAEHATPIAAGLTNEQLHECLGATFSQSLMALSKFEEAFPHLVTWEEEGEE
ncbi:Putative bacterial sensory transduction regulator [Corynebacterium mustelae]|uniref:Putative bacterial sensory transduction regulator n=1 Tax=Corynebacterium mustelae TaxID=571915 RepID=A0A0G3GV12_9CORY|nr:YbjN domain-containing protein [Corynebacterium mustelae]AKK05021.1 Putative bacterial sensory transduction regulator [Corynebacterium mustelae]